MFFFVHRPNKDLKLMTSCKNILRKSYCTIVLSCLILVMLRGPNTFHLTITCKLSDQEEISQFPRGLTSWQQLDRDKLFYMRNAVTVAKPTTTTVFILSQDYCEGKLRDGI